MAMHLATQNSDQFRAAGCVTQQLSEEFAWNVSPADVGDVIESLTASMLNELLKSLRAALSLR
jgi:hypothetical protein